MTPQAALKTVTGALDALVAAAEPCGGLFPSILDRRTNRMPEALPEEIPGQRRSDRAHPGSNLMHDEPTLRTLLALARTEGRPDYAEAAEHCFSAFATRCTGTTTGLFPWGEHAFWHLAEERVGDAPRDLIGNTPPSATHDHLRQAPVWLWEKLYAARPEAVVRFAEGLEWHWVDEAHTEYVRHAWLEMCHRYGSTDSPRSCDFPRHAGFFVLDWAFAFAKTGREDFLRQIRRMLDYNRDRRRRGGLLPIETRSPPDNAFYRANSAGQTLSLGVSLLDAAPLLDADAPAVAERMREEGGGYLEAFLAAPHDPEAGLFVNLCDAENRAPIPEHGAMPVWGSRYGSWPAAYVALTALGGYRHTADPRLLGWAEAAGRAYAQRPLPEGVPVPAMDAGLALGLLADLHDQTGEAAWLEGAGAMSERLLDVYFEENVPLPRGAAGIDWYESQMGPGFLLHGLARAALLARDGRDQPLEADYTAR